IYRPTASYGHFGRSPYEREYQNEVREGGKILQQTHKATAFTWERTDKADELRSKAGLK
ncbi:MAG: methionine adenosyltransferase, partial [Gammaproteobacteria bacterium]